MLSTIYNTILVNPLFNLLAIFYEYIGSLGFSIIGLTLFIKIITIPVMAPSLKSMKKQRELQPELEKLKAKFKYDKKMLAEKQMALMKQHGLNPAAGCYTMIITILIFTALYTTIQQITNVSDVAAINARVYFEMFKFDSLEPLKQMFFYLDLAKPDPYYILAILAGITQLVVAKMSMPYVETGVQAAKKTPDKKDDIAYNMQKQSLYIMPAMMAVLGASMPSGVIIYIITSTLFSIGQTYFTNGLGGLQSWIVRKNK